LLDLRPELPAGPLFCSSAVRTSDLGITSMYLQGIDNAEIVDAVQARRAPMVLARPRYSSGDRRDRAAREASVGSRYRPISS
jgi:hypothetical protein